jgi:hypothetical protein
MGSPARCHEHASRSRTLLPTVLGYAHKYFVLPFVSLMAICCEQVISSTVHYCLANILKD